MSLVETGAVHLSALALAQHHLTEASSCGRARTAGRVEPLSEARYKVQFTASRVLKDKIERAQNLLRHKYPSGDLAVVMERAVDALLVELEKKTLGKTTRARTTQTTTSRAGRPQARKTPAGKTQARLAHMLDPGRVSRAARREVFARDGERCSFVDAEGGRCSARGFLQIDHVDPRGRGGSGAVENLRILCQAHNRFAAEQIFGRKHIERATHLRQRNRLQKRHSFQGPDPVLRALEKEQDPARDRGRAPKPEQAGECTALTKLVSALT